MQQGRLFKTYNTSFWDASDLVQMFWLFLCTCHSHCQMTRLVIHCLSWMMKMMMMTMMKQMMMSQMLLL
jgi:hypothetical protein